MIKLPSSSDVHRLIYFSTTGPSFPIDECAQDQEIGKIISVALVNNRVLGVTGLLLFCQQWFMQVLEGSSAAVMEIYGRILLDVRHENINLICAGPAQSRLFPEWNMCAKRLSPEDTTILREMDGRGAFDPAHLTPDSALNLLIAVKTIQEYGRNPKYAHLPIPR